MPHSLLTIDVWDTVLRRRCHPDEVKLFAARALWLRFNFWIRPEYTGPTALLHLRQRCEHQIGLARVISGADDEYRFDEVVERWVRAAFVEVEAAFLASAVATIRQIELGQEHEVSYADAGLTRLLESIGADHMVALSDFYLPSEDLRDLLAAKAPGLAFSEVLVSCDVSLNKRSGRLFSHTHERFRLQPDQHVHVGDNLHSDVTMPTALGVRAIHYFDPPEEATRHLHRERWTARQTDLSAMWPTLACELSHGVQVPPELTPDQSEIFIAGVRAAPLFVGLVLRAIEEAIKRSVPVVHYFTREGVFYERIHRALAAAAPGSTLVGTPIPGSALLEVSRLATFAASIQSVTTHEFMRLWNLYSTQPMKSMLSSLDLPEFQARPLLQMYGLDADTPVEYPWADPRVQALFADRRFVRLVERKRDRHRADLKTYLASRGFADDGRPKVVVDIGWRGTIQDNLAWVFPSSTLHGVYLGMHATLNTQPPNVTKIAYAADSRVDPVKYGNVIKYEVPFEMTSNSPEGSVIGYGPDTTAGAAPGSMAAIRDHNPEESAAYDRCAKYFQDGVVAAVPVLARWIRDYAVSAQDLHPIALNAMRTLVADPPMPMVRAYFDLKHNETFGLGGFVEMTSHSPKWLAKAVKTDPFARSEMDQLEHDSRWPCAFHRFNGLEEMRAEYARTTLGARRLVDYQATDPAAAAFALQHLEKSGSWKLVRRIKRSWPMRALARLRFGKDWDTGPGVEDPVARLRWITGGRTFRVIQAIKAWPMVKERGRRRYGVRDLERW